ncbi:hypothetical protein C8Q80DRAFT_1136045 [Daedaleopsis nitida]|nr:hypothetical protein C8Q80DRAFT_1136045 [Daedaleopsis nitida]
MSTPNLRAAAGSGSMLPKGKQRWLSAETWCDALFLPRPRFALRVDGEGSSGRIVSPPGSPIWPSEMEQANGVQARTLKKSVSAIQLSPRSAPPSPPRPPPPMKEAPPRPQPGPSRPPPPPPPPPPPTEPADTTTQLQPNGVHPQFLKPHRPKSWALDDLALPSPVPSLAKVLKDGEKLKADRKAWQQEAAKSFADRQARSFSRARSKSIGARAASHAREPSTFEAIAEVTLLGSQRRRPTVHVRVHPPRSDGHATSSGGGTNTISGTTTGLGTFTSTSHSQSHAHTRNRSHAHSNSLGSIAHSRSDESFMWTPGHGRNHSLGLCGISGMASEDGREKTKTMDEKAAAMEEALRQDGTKTIHLRDQIAREARTRDAAVVVVASPPSATLRAGEQGVGPGGMNGVSPTPSGLSTSEGIGIALGSPVPLEDPFEKDPILIPAHPYAQGAGAHPYYQRAPGKAPIVTVAHAEPSNTLEDGMTKHRQPVKVHPYSPYTQVQHPYADPGPSSRMKQRPSRHLEVVSPKSSMFAELSPGTIREIMPDDIQYSPYISTPPIRVSELAPSAAPKPSLHPYASASNRMSEWGFADALTHTMHRSSPDSGIGTSEAHEVPPVPPQPAPERPTFARVLEDSEDMIVISPDQELEEEMHAEMAMPVPDRRRPRIGTHGSSNHTLASSPMESLDPPIFRPDLHAGEQSFHSSGSSPGVISNQSSPPVSPRPANSSDDLEQFRDLFYRPPERTPSSDNSPARPPVSRKGSGAGSIPIDLGARSTRSLSGLTTLARQLSMSMDEMQENEHALEEADRVSPMWGSRHGHRPEGFSPGPVSQSSSRSGYRREGTQSPLRLPLDEDSVLSQPVHMVPEDVESSRASSMLEMPLDDELDGECDSPDACARADGVSADLRVGEVEAVRTPPASSEPKRFSTHLTQMQYVDTDGELSPTSPEDERRRITSQSSLGVPLSSADAARSSFMTNTSGMSRLSDFPAPPSMVTAGHLSILNAYYGDVRERPGEEGEPVRPGLVREASQATFGRQQMGEAL